MRNRNYQVLERQKQLQRDGKFYWQGCRRHGSDEALFTIKVSMEEAAL
jgi:hypothetical protein